MTKKEIEKAERLLDERWTITFMEEPKGREPDLLFYKGMLELIQFIGCNWTRNENGEHRIFNN